MSRAVVVIDDTAIVTLTRGYRAVIDACDVHLVDGRNWSALVSPRRKSVYACRVENRKMILMHRLIFGASPGQEVDHRDGDGLNNRRDNLRVCSRRQNLCNAPVRKDNRSGLKGAMWDSRAKRWRAEISVGGKRVYLGSFKTAEEAHAAYAAAATIHYGEFARLS